MTPFFGDPLEDTHGFASDFCAMIPSPGMN